MLQLLMYDKQSAGRKTAAKGEVDKEVKKKWQPNKKTVPISSHPLLVPTAVVDVSAADLQYGTDDITYHTYSQSTFMHELPSCFASDLNLVLLYSIISYVYMYSCSAVCTCTPAISNNW